MILTGPAPRTLSRLGFLAVLGLGFLLPVLPTWGQDDGDKDEKQIEKKDIIKKLKDETLKKIDVDAIKKEVRDALDKDLNLDLDLAGLGDLKIDLNLDLEGLMENLDNLGELSKDGAGRKDLARARAEIQRAMAQVERAKAQFERAQAVLQKAQAKLAEAETAAKANPDKGDKDKTMKKEKILKDMTDKNKKYGDKVDRMSKDKSVTDKADYIRKRGADARSKDDDLEKRLDKLMREVQDLGRELKQRRRSADKDKDEEE